MSVTKRFILIVCAGLPGLAVCTFFRFHTLFFILYNMLCFGLLAIDYFISPNEKSFIVYRQISNKLYFMTENTMRIRVRNLTRLSVKMEIKDDVPDRHFKIAKKELIGTLPPQEETEFIYRLIPTKRGCFSFRSIYIKYTSRIGLCHKYVTYMLPVEYKVYPGLPDVSKYSPVTRQIRFHLTGERRFAITGGSTEYESLRDYIDGDDYRRINWTATARENRLIVNQLESEKNQPIFIMVDAGRPMSFSINGYRKLDCAVNTALILADTINQNGDNSGLLVFSTEVKSLVRPGKGTAHRNSLMEVLYHIEATKSTSDYERAFLALCDNQKRRSIVFVFTDFETVEEAAELAEAISILKGRHIPIVVLMEDHGLRKLTQAPDRSLKDAYHKGIAYGFLEERREIIKALRAKDLFCVESSAEDFTMTAINRYLAIKQR